MGVSGRSEVAVKVSSAGAISVGVSASSESASTLAIVSGC